MAVQDDAYKAMLESIKTVAEKVVASDHNPAAKAQALANLGAAYRHVVGGPQPGNIVIEK